MQQKQWTWRQEAACHDFDTELFFPDSDEKAGPAIAICATCPVREECLDFALSSNQADGVWGGTTETERRRIRRRRRQAA